MLQDHQMGLPLAPLAERLIALKPELKSKFGITGLSAFGSYVHNEAGPQSDLDLLIDFDRTPTLFDLARLDQMLEDALGVKVDTIPRDSLNPRYAPFILAELVPV